MSIGDLLKMTERGVTVADYEDIRADLHTSFKGIYGADAEIGPETMDGQLLDVFALAIRDTGNMAAAVYNNQNPLTASGDALRRWVTLQGITPKKPTPSTMNIVVTVTVVAAQNGYKFGKVRLTEPGNPGVTWVWDGIMPTGATVVGTSMYYGPVKDGKLSFAAIAVCESTGPVAPTSVVSAALNIVSVEANSAALVSVNAGQLIVQSSDTQWSESSKTSAIIAPVQGSLGMSYEGNDELRLRMQRSFAMLGSSTVAALEAALNNIPGVREAKVYENARDSIATVTPYSSMRMEPHSILCLVRSPYILPATMYMSALVRRIFDTIAAKKSPGCTVSVGLGTGFSGTNFGTGIGTGLVEKFVLATPVYVSVTITVAPGRSYTEALERLIVQGVSAYFDTVQLGQIVYAPDVTCVVRDIITANGGGTQVVRATFQVEEQNVDRWNGALYFYGYPSPTVLVVRA